MIHTTLNSENNEEKVKSLLISIKELDDSLSEATNYHKKLITTSREVEKALDSKKDMSKMKMLQEKVHSLTTNLKEL